MAKLLIWIIRLYQRGISPHKPPCCRFMPTCSQYAVQALTKYGFLKGGYLSLRRVLRCHPLSKKSGYDPVP